MVLRLPRTPGCECCEEGPPPQPPSCTACDYDPIPDLVFVLTYLADGGTASTVVIPLTYYAPEVGAVGCLDGGSTLAGGHWSAYNVEIPDYPGAGSYIDPFTGEPAHVGHDFHFFCNEGLNDETDGGFAIGAFVAIHYKQYFDGPLTASQCRSQSGAPGYAGAGNYGGTVSVLCNPRICFVATMPGDTYIVPFPGGAHSNQYDLKWVIGPAAPPPVTANVCVTVLGPSCDAEPGPPVEGVPVDVLTESGMTDAAGEVCLEVTGSGLVTVTATPDGCDPITGTVYLGECGGDAAITLRTCCIVEVCIVVKDLDSGDPIEGATIQDLTEAEREPHGWAALGGTWTNTDADGRSCRTIDVTGLPPDSPITYGLVIGHDGPPARISRCLGLPISCCLGSQETEIRLAIFPDDYVQPDPEDPSCCPNDCEEAGPAGRNLQPTHPDIAYEITWKDTLGATIAAGKYEGTIDWDNGTLSPIHYERTCSAATIAPTIDCGGMGGVWGYVKIDLDLCQGGPGTIRSRWYEDSGCATAGSATEFPTCLNDIDVTSTLSDESNQSEILCNSIGIDNLWTDTIPGIGTIEHHLVVVGP